MLVDSHRVQVAEMSSTNTVLAVQCPNDTVDYRTSISIDGSNRYLVTFDEAAGIDRIYDVCSQRGLLN